MSSVRDSSYWVARLPHSPAQRLQTHAHDFFHGVCTSHIRPLLSSHLFTARRSHPRIVVGKTRLPATSNLRPVACMRPRTAMNPPQHKIVNLLKTFFCSSVLVSVCVFNVWPKTTLLLPVWPRPQKFGHPCQEANFGPHHPRSNYISLPL